MPGPLNARNVDEYVNHLRAIRRGLEPDDDTPAAEAMRRYAAQGMIDGAIGLIMPPTVLPAPIVPTSLAGQRHEVIDASSRQV